MEICGLKRYYRNLYSKSKDITNQVILLIENMNKSFLTSIGVTIAAGLGYLAKPNILILKVAATMYAVYILINAALTIPFYWFRVKEIIDDYKEHLKSYNDIIITGFIPKDALKKCNTKFRVYWIISIVLYIFIIMSAIVSVVKTREIIEFAKKIFL